VLERWTALKDTGEPPFPALQQAVDAVFDARIGDISGRGRLATDMREIWAMQPRFERRTPGAAAALVNQPRFRAGYDFLRLRADAGELPSELADWWEDYHLGSDEDREAMLAELRAASGARARRVPGPRSTAPGAAEGREGRHASEGHEGRQGQHGSQGRQGRQDSQGHQGPEGREGGSDPAYPAAASGEQPSGAGEVAPAAEGGEASASRRRRRRRRRPAAAAPSAEG
jgi:poly(A) polymerase